MQNTRKHAYTYADPILGAIESESSTNLMIIWWHSCCGWLMRIVVSAVSLLPAAELEYKFWQQRETETQAAQELK
jgi:hypothetical protein